MYWCLVRKLFTFPFITYLYEVFFLPICYVCRGGIYHYYTICMYCTAGADPNVRDWSGRKPRQYQTNQDITSLSADTYRSEYARPEKLSAAAKLLLFSSLPRPKRRVKKNAQLSSLSFSHATQTIPPFKFTRERTVVDTLGITPTRNSATSRRRP